MRKQIFLKCYKYSACYWISPKHGPQAKIKVLQNEKCIRKMTLSMISSITLSDRFIPDSASVATTICFTCKS